MLTPGDDLWGRCLASRTKRRTPSTRPGHLLNFSPTPLADHSLSRSPPSRAPAATLHRGQACPARPGLPSPGTPMTARVAPVPVSHTNHGSTSRKRRALYNKYVAIPSSESSSPHPSGSLSLCDVDMLIGIGGGRGETGQDCDGRGDWPGLGWARQREAWMADLAGRGQRNEPDQADDPE